MPSPIAHSAAGWTIWQLMGPQGTSKSSAASRLARLGLVLLLANIPDLDFLPQILTGERFHHGGSHSLLVTLIFGVVAGWVAWKLLDLGFRRAFLLMAAVYGVHILLDTLGGGPGVQLWWPFSYEYVRAPLMVFPPVHYTRGLLDSSHLTFLTFELVFSGILASALYLWKRWTGHDPAQP